MGSQHAKLKKGSSENVDKSVSSRHSKGKKSKCADDGNSVSSLDITPSADDDVLAISDYEPSINSAGSTIVVKKGDSLLVYGQSSAGDWLDVLCRRTGERGWVPASCVLDTSMSNPSPIASGVLSRSIVDHVSCPSLLGERWYHGAVHRSYAEYLLSSGITGSFLVRESESSFGKLTLSLRSDGRIFHYRICNDENNQFYINDTSRFTTVSELVQHHEKVADGLACPLLYGISKRDQCGNRGGALDSDYDAWEIDRTDIIMKHKLGSGQYGVVYEAIFKPYDVTVAVKTLKEDITLRDEFLQEARLMKSLRHPNLVRLLGVCTQEPPYYIITEFMCNGNLLDYLRTQPRNELTPPALLQMAIHVCCAMTYLEEHNFIHRDLAARNCLVGEGKAVKVADFGLARYMERDVTYRAREGAKFPIKWTAPEGLVYNCFSIKSDVWAFGVLLWEIATYGATPYPGVELQDVYVLLEKGTRMEAPEGCPDAVYQLMLDCWAWDSEKRPSFKEVFARLETVRTSSDINEAVEHELQRHRIRLPPPPLPPPSIGPSATPTITPPVTPRRSSSCDRIEEAVSNSDKVLRRAGASGSDSFNQHHVSPYPPVQQSQFPAYPSHHQLGQQGCIMPGNRFSEVFPSTVFPPPPPPPILNADVDGSDGVMIMSGAGSLGRRKAAPPAPPQRTTTLKTDDSNEKAHDPPQISTDDRPGFSWFEEEYLPSPPDALLSIANLSQSPSISPLSITSSAMLSSITQPANPRRMVIPVPPQRSESTRSQNALSGQLHEGVISKSSPKWAPVPSVQSPPNGLTGSNNSGSSGNLDFHAELSSRLKRQLEAPRLVEVSTRLPTTPAANASTVTAEMIQASKSKLKATFTTSSSVVPETQLSPQPVVPAWKELVVQRRLKNASECQSGKRMSWTPTSNSSLKHNQSAKTNVEAVSEVAEEVDETTQGGDVPAIMSQSVTLPPSSSTSSQSPNYEALLKQITDLCADLKLAKVNLPSDHNNALIDRIEGLKKACLGYADEVDGSAHAKFRFRDDCARLQKAADTLRVVCGFGSGKQPAASELGGRRKTFQSVYTTVEAIHQSLLRLAPVTTPSIGSIDESSNNATSSNSIVSTGVT